MVRGLIKSTIVGALRSLRFESSFQISVLVYLVRHHRGKLPLSLASAERPHLQSLLVVVGHMLRVEVGRDAELALEATNALVHLVRGLDRQRVAPILRGVHDAEIVVALLALWPDVSIEAARFILERLIGALEHALPQARCRTTTALLLLLIQVKLHLRELAGRWHVIREADEHGFFENVFAL